MQFVTKEQIDEFYVKFKDKDIVGLSEMLTAFQEVFDPSIRYPKMIKRRSQNPYS